MPTTLDEALELILGRAHDDPELAAALRTVLTGALARLPGPDAAGRPEVDDRAVSEAASEPNPGPVPETGPNDEDAAPAPGPTPVFVTLPELGSVGRNLRLKARASRWLARYGYTEDPDALGERYAILDEARPAGCYLWMFDRGRVDPNDEALLAELAGLFDLTATALDEWQDAGGTPEERAADGLLAEAQAALRTAAYDAAAWRDPDQTAIYGALRLAGQASRTFYPQLNTAYRPKPLADLEGQLADLARQKDERRAEEKRVAKGRGKLRYHAALVAKNPADRAQWEKVREAARDLSALGARADDLLEPLRDLAVPGDLPELKALLESKNRPAAEPAHRQTAHETPSGFVTRARELLEGRVVVVVGGDARPEAVGQLEAAFGCTVRWLESAPHTSLSAFEPAITEGVAAVLLLIRWSSHAYGELARFCKARGVPLVRLAGGYSPNRVAFDLLEQAGERLGAAGA